MSSIRILGGKAKGLPLLFPPEKITRPTSMMLKRRPFDYRQNWSGIVFVDLGAGSGAMGFEAWSRGSDEVYWVENHPKALSVLKKNLSLALDHDKKLGQSCLLKVEACDLLKWLKNFKSTYLDWPEDKRQNVAIFLDPPYEKHQLYLDVRQELLAGDWFKGEFWVESDATKGLDEQAWPETFGAWRRCKQYHHGSSFILCYTLSSA